MTIGDPSEKGKADEKNNVRPVNQFGDCPLPDTDTFGVRERKDS